MQLVTIVQEKDHDAAEPYCNHWYNYIICNSRKLAQTKMEELDNRNTINRFSYRLVTFPLCTE